MKNIYKNPIIMFVLGVIVTATVGVSATILYQANEIGFTPADNNWNVNNLESALNDLYANKGSGGSVTKFCTFINSNSVNTELYDNTNHLSIGSKYSCDPGDGTPRNFYVLEVSDNNVRLIMEENIEKILSWTTALNYFDGTENGRTIKSTWINVQGIELPSALAISKAVGRTDWNPFTVSGTSGWWYLEKNGNSWGQTSVANANNLSVWRWLFNYTKTCTNFGCDSNTDSSTYAEGYWTNSPSSANGSVWYINYEGALCGYYNSSTSNRYGVRPVITVLKGNLQG